MLKSVHPRQDLQRHSAYQPTLWAAMVFSHGAYFLKPLSAPSAKVAHLTYKRRFLPVPDRKWLLASRHDGKGLDIFPARRTDKPAGLQTAATHHTNMHSEPRLCLNTSNGNLPPPQPGPTGTVGSHNCGGARKFLSSVLGNER